MIKMRRFLNIDGNLFFFFTSCYSETKVSAWRVTEGEEDCRSRSCWW
jgi:hypothetical protein